VSRAPRTLAALIAVALAAGGGGASAVRAAGTGTPLRLTIAFTGDASGYLEPCG
jgi:hypothetical protein